MKTITLIFALFFTLLSNGQEKFAYNENGLTPEYLVGETDGKTQQEIYTKTLNWVKETYKNPDEVIKTTIENEKIRFEGVEMDLMCHSALGSTTCYNTTYTIEIEFREGKYKFTPLSITYRIPATQYTQPMTETVVFSTGEYYYNKKGALKSRTKTIPESVEILLNGLNDSLNKYILKESSSEKW